MSLRRARIICGWCTRQSSRLVLWSTWLVLLAALAGQVHLLSSRRVPVPEPLQRLVKRRAAEAGLQVRFERARMDFAGRFLIENIRVGSISRDDTLATARAAYVRFNPWDLFLGDITLTELRMSGLNLIAPASPSGPEISVGRFDFTLELDGRRVRLSQFSGYAGGVPVRASGEFMPPRSDMAPESDEEMVEDGTVAYLRLAELLRVVDTWAGVLDSPVLHLDLGEGDAVLHFGADALDLAALPQGIDGRLTGVRASARIPFLLSPDSVVEVTARVDAAELPQDVRAREIAFRLQATPEGAGRFSPRALDAQIGSLAWRAVDVAPLTVSALPAANGAVQADVALTLAGAPWRLQAVGSPEEGAAQVWLNGWVDDATLRFAGEQIGKDLAELLDPAAPAPLHVHAVFDPGWRLARAGGRLHSGAVRVGKVHLDETGTEFTYDGERVLCENLVLRQGASLAHGSYEMDTRTNDFRFLLTGGLRPHGISGWFHEWWTNFWDTFDFARELPLADVDVRGRWGDLTATRVFVQAEGGQTGLKGVAFDRVRTRLFLRPHWFDILHFEVLQDGRDAQGWLTRSLDLEQDTWRFMEFAVDSTLQLETIVALFQEESAELLAPYQFTQAPRLRLAGRVDAAISPEGKQERIDIDLDSSGEMTYHAFPLSNLKFTARLRNDVLELPVLSTDFAEGQANGNARLWGAADARRLAFDITLANANLGAVSQAIAKLQPPAEPSGEAASEAARRRQERIEKGRLVFSLKAEGTYPDFHSFKGEGRAAITGAELAQLNLFGPLSATLRTSYLTFGSFSLTTVDAPFQLDGDRVHFDDLRVTGPSALLLAKGDYHLRDGRLDFTAKLHPFDESASVVGNAVSLVLTPFSTIFEVKLQGTYDDPSWIFSYGPSRLFHTLTGSEKGSSRPSPLTPKSEP